MAKIVLATVGSTGDALPYVALGRALVRRGHEVRVGSHDLHRARFEGAGLDFVETGAPLDIDTFNAVLDEILGLAEPFSQFERLAHRVFLADPEKQLEDHRALSADADLVVAHWFDYVAQEAAIQNGVPWIGMTYMPETLRTDEAPVFGQKKLGKWWSKLTWDNLDEMAAPLRAHVQATLQALGGEPRPLAIVGALSPTHNFLAAPRELMEVRGDWPSNLEVTGAWFAEEPAFTPDAELAAFLEAHGRPVVVSFGSMGGTKSPYVSDVLRGALRATGRAAIVQRGYSGLVADEGDVLEVGYVPHDWLFARAGCVVHHAGSGTAAAVARAGVPSVPVPHLFDQYFWAGMLHQKGAAPKPLFRNQLEVEPLVERLVEALDSDVMRTAAAELGAKVRAEDGVERAVDRIEQLLASLAS